MKRNCGLAALSAFTLLSVLASHAKAEELGMEVRVNQNRRMVVTDVPDGSLAKTLRIREGDIIKGVGNQNNLYRVEVNVARFKRILRDIPRGNLVRVVVDRNGRRLLLQGGRGIVTGSEEYGGCLTEGDDD